MTNNSHAYNESTSRTRIKLERDDGSVLSFEVPNRPLSLPVARFVEDLERNLAAEGVSWTNLQRVIGEWANEEITVQSVEIAQTARSYQLVVRTNERDDAKICMMSTTLYPRLAEAGLSDASVYIFDGNYSQSVHRHRTSRFAFRRTA